MSYQKSTSEQTSMPRWKTEIQKSIRNLEQLKPVVKLTAEEEEKLPEILKRFQMSITPYYSGLIDKTDVNDPIKKLIVPSTEELSVDGYLDTSGEEDNTKVRGLQHKYGPTALLLPTSVCAAYCRYCFRKRLTLSNQSKFETSVDWDNAFAYLQEHKEIDNVLITGGDPMILPNDKLEFILKNLREIDHIKMIRIGTKFLAFNPFRFMDEELLGILKKYSSKEKRIYVIAHYDHPREITQESLEAVDLLLKNGIHLVNQAVFHKGINDDAEIIADLHNKLYAAGIAPYYLFQLRPVKGSLQYRIPMKRGLKIFEQAKQHMSGPAKRVRYIMSHYTGKIEIFGLTEVNGEEHFILKYHQARNSEDIGKIVLAKARDDACWLSDLVDVKEICTPDKEETITDRNAYNNKFAQASS